MIIIFHNKTKIKYDTYQNIYKSNIFCPAQQEYFVLHNKNIFDEQACILKQKQATYFNKITCPKRWHVHPYKD